MNALFKLVPGALIAASLAASTPALAEDGAGEEALAEFRGEFKEKDAIQNRFFLKAKRFEIAPVLGYVPNNPMVRRYVGGVLLGYHFSETFAVGGQILYSPDLGETDLKDLTTVLVDIAASGEDSVEFQQPLDKMTLGATFSANWAPIYGKINLVGETVLNFDLYGSLGLGMLSIAQYYAQYDENALEGEAPVNLSEPSNTVTVPLNIGLGTDFFLNQTIALKIDARSYIYIGDKPQYDPNEPVDEKRVYNNFIASAGISIFLPKMQPRMTNF
jgi:outer membrane beta-barrel protein